MPDDRLLTVQQVADRLGCHHTTIRRAIARQDLACLRLGGLLRIRPEHVTAYMERCECPARDQTGADPTGSGMTLGDEIRRARRIERSLAPVRRRPTSN